ncbi:hypothetical protein GQ54DRAFT_95663 [Martensiomyces pterosporus]|nr:hypothetical protein GQ54DRAFT_95663 [Martensiomyces pterosporus]
MPLLILFYIQHPTLSTHRCWRHASLNNCQRFRWAAGAELPMSTPYSWVIYCIARHAGQDLTPFGEPEMVISKQGRIWDELRITRCVTTAAFCGSCCFSAQSEELRFLDSTPPLSFSGGGQAPVRSGLFSEQT